MTPFTNITRLPALVALLLLAVACGGGDRLSSAGGSLDSDEDGLSDVEEVEGWEILVDNNGYARPGGTTGETAHLEVREVSSDPTLTDTDGDGLDDSEERRVQSDPRRADTDGDGLTDYEEVRIYDSIPNSVDSDGDARGELSGIPRSTLFDGEEVARLSSPILVDTDADGLGDYQEITTGSNPAVADLPKIELHLTSEPPEAFLNSVVDESGTTILEQRDATLTASSATHSTTDSSTNEETYSFTESASAEVGYSFPGFSASATVGFEASQSFSNSTTHEVSHETSQTNQAERERALTEEASTGVSYEDGTLEVNLEIVNASDGISFLVSDLVVMARFFDPAMGQMRNIAELTPTNPDFETTMAAGDRVELQFRNAEVDPDKILAVMANPSSLTFEVTRYALSRQNPEDAEDRIDYAALSEFTTRQTGLVIVDFGDGRVERYAVASNLRRDEEMRIEGITMEEIMRLLGDRLDFGVADGVLRRVDATEATENAAEPVKSTFWAVLGGNGDAGFENIRVEPGDTVMLAYMEDNDGDLVADRFESMRATDPALYDTDGDGLCDGPEAVYDCWGAETNHSVRDVQDVNFFGHAIGAALVPDSLVGYYAMQDVTIMNGTSVLDGSAAGNDGALLVEGDGVRAVADRFGYAERAIAFGNGASDFAGVTIPNVSFSDEIAISAWVEPESTDGSIVEVADQFGIRLQDGRVTAHLGTRTVAGPSLPAGAWAHVTATAEHRFIALPIGGYFVVTVSLYVDGELAATTDIHWGFDFTLDGDVVIANPQGLAGGYAGGIDDVRVYERALSRADIQSLNAEGDFID